MPRLGLRAIVLVIICGSLVFVSRTFGHVPTTQTRLVGTGSSKAGATWQHHQSGRHDAQLRGNHCLGGVYPEGSLGAPAEARLWMYWEGKNKPPYVGLCLKTLQKHLGSPKLKLVMLDDDSVAAMKLPGLHRSWREIQPMAMRGDYIRANLVYQKGGIYTDADVIGMGNLYTQVFQLLCNHSFVGYHHKWRGDVSVGFFAARQFDPALKAWIDSMNSVLNKGRTTLKWSEGARALRLNLKDGPRWRYKGINASETVYPVHWTKSKSVYWSPGNATKYLRANQPVILLHNAMYSKEAKAASEEEVLHGEEYSSNVISQLLRASLSDDLRSK